MGRQLVWALLLGWTGAVSAQQLLDDPIPTNIDPRLPGMKCCYCLYDDSVAGDTAIFSDLCRYDNGFTGQGCELKDTFSVTRFYTPGTFLGYYDKCTALQVTYRGHNSAGSVSLFVPRAAKLFPRAKTYREVNAGCSTMGGFFQSAPDGGVSFLDPGGELSFLYQYFNTRFDSLEIVGNQTLVNKEASLVGDPSSTPATLNLHPNGFTYELGACHPIDGTGVCMAKPNENSWKCRQGGVIRTQYCCGSVPDPHDPRIFTKRGAWSYSACTR